MYITKIRVGNFFGVKLFQYSGLGKFNEISGKNGEGKSSIIAAVKEAFISSGKDPRLIRNGATESEIYIELDNKIEINRTIALGKNDVSVVNDGQPVLPPVTYLRSILGEKIGKQELFFNPVAFYEADARKRREMLLKALPFTLGRPALSSLLKDKGFEDVDYGDVDFNMHGLEVLAAIKKTVYERRHEQNTTVEQLKKAIQQSKKEIPDTFDPDKYRNFDLQAAMAEIEAANTKISEHERDKQSLVQLRQAREELEADIEQTRARLAMLEEKLEKINEQGYAMKDKVESFKAPSVELARAAIAEYKESQKLLHKVSEIETRQKSLGKEVQAHEYLDKLYVCLNDEVSRTVLEQIDMPIKGLSVEGDEILINGVAIDNLSTSEKMRLSVKIARLLMPEDGLRVICVDDIEHLDSEAFEAFEDETKEDGVQYIVCRVSDGPLEMAVDDKSGNGDKPRRVKRKTLVKG